MPDLVDAALVGSTKNRQLREFQRDVVEADRHMNDRVYVSGVKLIVAVVVAACGGDRVHEPVSSPSAPSAQAATMSRADAAVASPAPVVEQAPPVAEQAADAPATCDIGPPFAAGKQLFETGARESALQQFMAALRCKPGDQVLLLYAFMTACGLRQTQIAKRFYDRMTTQTRDKVVNIKCYFPPLNDFDGAD